MVNFRLKFLLLLIPLLLSGQIRSGEAVPQLVFHDLAGKLVFLNDYVGEPRMLNAGAERMNTSIIFFRVDDPRLPDWLPKIVEQVRSQRLTCIFAAVDGNAAQLQTMRKNLKLRAFLVIDKYGSAAEELGFSPLSRFQQAPSAVILSKDGTVVSVFENFQGTEIPALIQSAAALNSAN